MIYSLVDNGIYVLIALAVAALALGFLWYQRRSRPLLFALAGVGAAFLVVLLLWYFVDTDRRQLTRIVDDLVTGLNARRYDAVMKHVADPLKIDKGNGFVPRSKAAVLDAAKAYFDTKSKLKLFYKSVEVDKLQPPDAVVTCLFRPEDIEFFGGMGEMHFTQNAQGTWLLTGFRLYKGLPGSPEKTIFPVPIP